MTQYLVEEALRVRLELVEDLEELRKDAERPAEEAIARAIQRREKALRGRG